MRSSHSLAWAAGWLAADYLVSVHATSIGDDFDGVLASRLSSLNRRATPIRDPAAQLQRRGTDAEQALWRRAALPSAQVTSRQHSSDSDSSEIFRQGSGPLTGNADVQPPNLDVQPSDQSQSHQPGVSSSGGQETTSGGGQTSKLRPEISGQSRSVLGQDGSQTSHGSMPKKLRSSFSGALTDASTSSSKGSSAILNSASTRHSTTLSQHGSSKGPVGDDLPKQRPSSDRSTQFGTPMLSLQDELDTSGSHALANPRSSAANPESSGEHRETEPVPSGIETGVSNTEQPQTKAKKRRMRKKKAKEAAGQQAQASSEAPASLGPPTSSASDAPKWDTMAHLIMPPTRQRSHHDVAEKGYSHQDTLNYENRRVKRPGHKFKLADKTEHQVGDTTWKNMLMASTNPLAHLRPTVPPELLEAHAMAALQGFAHLHEERLKLLQGSKDGYNAPSWVRKLGITGMRELDLDGEHRLPEGSIGAESAQAARGRKHKLAKKLKANKGMTEEDMAEGRDQDGTFDRRAYALARSSEHLTYIVERVLHSLAEAPTTGKSRVWDGHELSGKHPAAAHTLPSSEFPPGQKTDTVMRIVEKAGQIHMPLDVSFLPEHVQKQYRAKQAEAASLVAQHRSKTQSSVSSSKPKGHRQD